MSVTIKWTGGRTGNDLFQYTFARIMAHKNNLRLHTEWPHTDFIEFTPAAPGMVNDKPHTLIQDLYHDEHNRDWHKENYKKENLLISGFFQHPKYYDESPALTRSMFILPPVEKRPPGDVVMHYRLGDYYEVGKGGSVIHPTWYTGILMQRLKFNFRKQKLFIVTDDPEDKILKTFQRFQPTIVSDSPKHDFNFLREFDTILCGNSSFSWWASYLSDASRIFTFSRWIREPHGKILRLAFMHRATPVLGSWR